MTAKPALARDFKRNENRNRALSRRPDGARTPEQPLLSAPTPGASEGKGKCDNVVAFEQPLEQLANRIADRRKQAGEALYDIGTALIEAKAALQHGDFLKFLRDPRVNIEHRAAQRKMKIARQEDGRRLADLGEHKAHMLIGAFDTPEKRAAFVAENDVNSISVVGLRNLLATAAKDRSDGAADVVSSPSTDSPLEAADLSYDKLRTEREGSHLMTALTAIIRMSKPAMAAFCKAHPGTEIGSFVAKLFSS